MRTMLKTAIPAALLVIAVAFNLFQWHKNAVQERQLAQDSAELQRLRSRAAAGPGSSPAQPASGVAPKVPAAEARRWPDGRVEDLAVRTAELERTQHELAGARATIEQLTAEVQAMKADHEKALTAAEQQAGALDARWRESFDSVNLTLEGVRTDLRAAKQEVAQLQADNQALRDANSSASAVAGETLRLMAQFQDLSRRREAYLNTILQRFRDITRQYRSFAAVVSAHRNDQPGPVLDDPDFTRIQGALASTQDDLRQLELLNGQAQQIERKLA